MNLQYLKYAVEVEKTRSINRAAENLYMAQPNLSRAIRELEKSLGITIFRRTPRGITVTPQGEEFLADARRILEEIDRVETRYRSDMEIPRAFSVTGPRAASVATAFALFAKKLGGSTPLELRYRETNPREVLAEVQQGISQLGILRFQQGDERTYREDLHARGLEWRELREWTPVLVVNRESPLAGQETIEEADLVNGVEIVLGDVNAPTVRLNPKRESSAASRRVVAYERAVRMELLKSIPGSFMWEEPSSAFILDRWDIVQRPCALEHRIFRDLLIFRRDYRFSTLAERFTEELEQYFRNMDRGENIAPEP